MTPITEVRQAFLAYDEARSRAETLRQEMILTILDAYAHGIGSTTLAGQCETTTATVTKWIRESGVAIVGKGGRPKNVLPAYTPGIVEKTHAANNPAESATFEWAWHTKFKRWTVLVTAGNTHVYVWPNGNSFDTMTSPENKKLGQLVVAAGGQDQTLHERFMQWVSNNPQPTQD